MDIEQSRPQPDSMWNKSYVGIILSNFMLCMGHASINPLIASYMKYMNASAQLAGFLAGMFFAVSFACHPFAGPAMTKLDKRRLLIWVFLLGAAANAGYALFHSVPMFIAFRFLSGVQYSLVGPLLIALCGDHLPKSKLAYGVGVFGMGGAIGNAVSPSIGAAILDLGTGINGESFGYTLLFLYGTVIFILAIIPSAIIAPDRKKEADIASTGAWYKNIVAVYSLPSSIVLLLLMVAYSMINTYIFEFAIERGIAGAGIFYIVLAASLAVTRPVSGFITDKIGVTRIAFPALMIFAFSMLIIGFSGTLWMALIGAVLAAIGYGSSQPALQTMCIQADTALRRGVATNTMYMGIDMGLFLGPYLGGLVYMQTDYATMFKTGALPVALAILCLIFVIPIHNRRIKELDG